MRKENKYLVIYGNYVRWNIAKNSTRQIKLKSNPKYSLINPIYYEPFFNAANPNYKISIVATSKGILVDCNAIVLKENDGDTIDESEGFIDKLYQHLRYLSGQASIKTNDSVSVMFTVKNIKFPKVNFIETHGMRMREYYLKARVTWRQVKEADSLINKNIKIEIYNNILLDALESLIKNEYKKTIIFSAIAVESMMNQQLDLVYSKILANPKNKFRVCEFQTSSGPQLKDPVYVKLKKNSNFPSLLHELPLYILGKSLLIENPQLYNKAKNLYTTRNKIAHLGGHDGSNDNLISITSDGAKDAYNTAIRIFKWMNMAKYNEYSNSFMKVI